MINWYDATIRPVCPDNADWEAEQKWIIETGFIQDAYVGHSPYDFPNLIKGKRRRTRNGVELPIPLDHLRIYRNPQTKKRVAVFHEFPGRADKAYREMNAWCEENGLEILRLEKSWYEPDICTAFLIREKADI